MGDWDWHIHTTIYKIINKDLLHSTGNYTQYFVLTCKGKESEKEYIYVKLNHCAVHLKLTRFCKSTILQFKKSTIRNSVLNAKNVFLYVNNVSRSLNDHSWKEKKYRLLTVILLNTPGTFSWDYEIFPDFLDKTFIWFILDLLCITWLGS